MKNTHGEATTRLKTAGPGGFRPVTRIMNLDQPEEARAFLDGLEVKGMGRVTFVCLSSGAQLKFKDMTDA